MNQDFIINITERAMILVLMLSMPPILIATFVGLITSLLQALTQIQEQTLGFAIKLSCTVLVLVLSAYWIGDELLAFANNLFTNFPSMIR
ncbi:MAG: type III secretion system export apparatus subunit SctS [Puniceicoccales bacterium]|jgi:type III secretion HrpO family protein|nr:type III secretion system export apparatus subunit SctS [Puniceicoccales bacterium]